MAGSKKKISLEVLERFSKLSMNDNQSNKIVSLTANESLMEPIGEKNNIIIHQAKQKQQETSNITSRVILAT